MSISYSGSLVVGITMNELFTETEIVEKIFDEYDRYGNKTGNQFHEFTLFGKLPNAKKIAITNPKSDIGESWKFNWYDSINFNEDGLGEYCGSLLNINLKIFENNYDFNKTLNDIVIGIEIIGSTPPSINKIDENITNNTISLARKQLAELFGYTGSIHLYLINGIH